MIPRDAQTRPDRQRRIQMTFGHLPAPADSKSTVECPLTAGLTSARAHLQTLTLVRVRLEGKRWGGDYLIGWFTQSNWHVFHRQCTPPRHTCIPHHKCISEQVATAAALEKFKRSSVLLKGTSAVMTGTVDVIPATLTCNTSSQVQCNAPSGLC